jgi:hypothetical protein
MDGSKMKFFEKRIVVAIGIIALFFILIYLFVGFDVPKKVMVGDPHGIQPEVQVEMENEADAGAESDEQGSVPKNSSRHSVTHSESQRAESSSVNREAGSGAAATKATNSQFPAVSPAPVEGRSVVKSHNETSSRSTAPINQPSAASPVQNQKTRSIKVVNKNEAVSFESDVGSEKTPSSKSNNKASAAETKATHAKAKAEAAAIVGFIPTKKSGVSPANAGDSGGFIPTKGARPTARRVFGRSIAIQAPAKDELDLAKPKAFKGEPEEILMDGEKRLNTLQD